MNREWTKIRTTLERGLIATESKHIDVKNNIILTLGIDISHYTYSES